MPHPIAPLFACLLPALAAGADRPPIFAEEDGILVIEAEATASEPGDWELRTDIPGYGGDGHLHFTGNREMSGRARSPLRYHFTIATPGTYRLVIRASRNAPEGTPGDQANDCYVRVDGDYASGGGAPLAILKDDTKLFGAKEDSWKRWAQRLDRKHEKYDALYEFAEGGRYILTVHGRSRSFNMDRIVFFHTDSFSLGEAKRRATP